MKLLSLTVLLAFLGISCSTTVEEKLPSFDSQALLTHVKVLASDSLEGRGFGTEGNRKAQAYIADQFKKLGIVHAFENGYTQPFRHTLKDSTTLEGGNVVATIEGETDKVIVITGHLDHLGIRNGEIYNGADDDASGTAALLAIAEYFRNKKTNHTLVFAAVDAEEIGSPGCQYLLDNFPIDKSNIVLNVNMDMIAHNDSSELYASGLYHYPQLKEPLTSIKSPITLLYGHDDPNNNEMEDWTFLSDHRVFHEAEIPFIYFGVDDHEDYHQPSDVFENINQEFYIETVKLIIQAIENYDVYLAKADSKGNV